MGKYDGVPGGNMPMTCCACCACCCGKPCMGPVPPQGIACMACCCGGGPRGLLNPGRGRPRPCPRPPRPRVCCSRPGCCSRREGPGPLPWPLPPPRGGLCCRPAPRPASDPFLFEFSCRRYAASCWGHKTGGGASERRVRRLDSSHRARMPCAGHLGPLDGKGCKITPPGWGVRSHTQPGMRRGCPSSQYLERKKTHNPATHRLVVGEGGVGVGAILPHLLLGRVVARRPQLLRGDHLYQAVDAEHGVARPGPGPAPLAAGPQRVQGRKDRSKHVLHHAQRRAVGQHQPGAQVQRRGACAGLSWFVWRRRVW